MRPFRLRFWNGYRQRTMINKPKIALLFDVNRTILIEDKAADKSKEEELTTLLASNIWGNIVDTSGEKSWYCHEKVQLGEQKKPGQESYYTFIQDYLLPFPDFPENLTLSERKKIIDDIKENRTLLIKNFTKDGNPGSCLKPILQDLLKSISYPESFTLLKAFYKTIVHFANHEKRHFSICFRTFGTDLNVLPIEWNRFCEGHHPLFPNIKFNGKDGTRDLRLCKENIGCFFRSGPDSQNCHLIMGTIEQPDFSKGEGLEIYNNTDFKIYSGFESIDDFLQQIYSKGGVIAIRDFYPWWAVCKEHYQSGKLLFIHKDEVWKRHSKRVRQIFFDDNLRMNNFKENNQLIADVRDIETGNSYHNIEELFDLVLFQADAIEAIKDDDYFIKLVNKAESLF